MSRNPAHEIKPTHTRKSSYDNCFNQLNEHPSIDCPFSLLWYHQYNSIGFTVKMAMGAPAGETPAKPIKRIPAYMLPKKPTYRQAQFLLKSTKSSRLQASRSMESRLEVSVDESYSANGDEEEQPSFDQAIPPKVRQYACQVYDADQVQTDLDIQPHSVRLV